MHTDILIVGGGLSGLALADKLQQAGRDFVLVEADLHLILAPHGFGPANRVWTL